MPKPINQTKEKSDVDLDDENTSASVDDADESIGSAAEEQSKKKLLIRVK